ncbi:MAG: hypothetical protein HY761_10705 [Candidatus Omnitrophica bacterium]|nr:hypothetical protein [Candidatus Omnitrophota bacterium]
MNRLIIRNFRENDQNNLRNIFSFLPGGIGFEHVFYKHSGFGPAHISVIEDTERQRILGHYAILRVNWSVFGKVIPGGKGEGAALDPIGIAEAIKDGATVPNSLFSDLIKFSLNNSLDSGLEIICTNPNDLALSGHLDSGHIILEHKYKIFLFIFNWRYLAHLFSKRINLKFLNNVLGVLFFVTLKFAFFLKTLVIKTINFEFEPIADFNEVSDALFNEFYIKNPCITINRQNNYLNWRLHDDRYKKFFIKYNGERIGYFVLDVFMNKNDFKEASLLDFIILPGYSGYFPALIRQIVSLARKEGCDLMRVGYVYDSKEKFNFSTYLQRLCFFSRLDKRNLTIFVSSKLGKMRKDLSDIRNWYFTDLYFEVYK